MDVSHQFLAVALHGAGWVLWLLVALSVVSVAIILERFWYFKNHRLDKRTMVADMRALLKSHGSPVAGPADLGGPANADIAAALDGAKARERLRLERNLAFLATLGSNAPFIGLFGTVLGIIKAFHDLAGSQGAAVRRTSWPASPRRWSPPRSAWWSRSPRSSPSTTSAVASASA